MIENNAMAQANRRAGCTIMSLCAGQIVRNLLVEQLFASLGKVLATLLAYEAHKVVDKLENQQELGVGRRASGSVTMFSCCVSSRFGLVGGRRPRRGARVVLVRDKF